MRGHLLVHHEAKDVQHSGIVVVELDGTLGEYILPVKVVLAKVNVTVVGVVNELVAKSFGIFSLSGY